MRRGIAPTVAGMNNPSLNTTISYKIPPLPLSQKGKVHLAKIPHPKPPKDVCELNNYIVNYF